MTGAFYNDSLHKYGDSAYHYDEAPPDTGTISYILKEDGSYLLTETGDKIILDSNGADFDRLLWRFEVAWTGNLFYYSDANGRNEADRMIGMTYITGRPNFVNYDGVGLARMTPGRLVVTLVNDDFRYDPNNASSPYYPNVKPGIFCRLGVRRINDDLCNWRFTGYITDVRCFQDPIDRANYVEISIADGWSWLQNKNIWLPLSQNADMNFILDAALRASAWPWGYVTDGGSSAFPYYWCGGDDVFQHLHQVAETQGDRIWIDGAGVMHTEKRTTADLLNTSFTQDKILINIPRTNPWQNLWNCASLKYISTSSPFTVTSITAWGDVFTLNITGVGATQYLYAAPVVNEMVIPANGTLAVVGNYSDSTPISSITNQRKYLASFITMSPPLSFDFYDGTGGTGTHRPGSVTIDSFTDGGSAFKAILRNNLAVPLYSRGMVVKSNGPLSGTSISNLTFDDDRSNGTTRKAVTINSPYMLSTLSTSAQNIVKYFADIVTISRVYPKITIEHRHDIQFQQLQNRININLALYSISSDYRVGQIEERWIGKNGQAVTTTILPEPYVVATA